MEKNKDVVFSVGFVLLDEFTLFALSGFVDALRLAGNHSDDSRQRDFSWTIVAPSMAPVRSNSGIEVLPWELYTQCSKFDYLVIVGGRVEPQRNTDQRIIQYIQEFAARGGVIVGLCTATFVLARAGIMNNRRCCIHWHHRDEFSAEFPELVATCDTVFVDDKNRITCPGGRSANDVALYLIEKHCGPVKARKAASGLVIEEIRGAKSPQPNVGIHWFRSIDNTLLRRAILIMDQFLSVELSMPDLANRLQVSENSLFRAFKTHLGISPAKLLRILRVSHAHWSLHHTALTLSQIAHMYQFSDASHFSKIHREYYGITPAGARAHGPFALDRKPAEMMAQSAMIKCLLLGELFLLDNKL